MEITTAQSSLSFMLGLGAGAGVIMFLSGVVGWFLVRKVDKYDSNCDRTEQHEVRISNIETVCAERHKRRK